MIEEHHIDVGGASSRVLEVDGDRDAAPFVLLHGFTDSADTWRPLLGRLERAGRRAVAIDLPGFGAASDARHGPVLPQFEAAVAAAVDRVGAEPAPVLVGNSMGGLTALFVANGRRVRTAGVVAVCTAGLHHPLWIRAMLAPGVRSVLPLVATAPVKAAVAAVASLPRARESAGSRHLSQYLRHLTRPRVAGQLALVGRLLDEETYPLDLGAIDQPVLFLWGGRDQLAVWRRNSRRLLGLGARVRGAQAQVVEHWGHTPQLQAPAELMAILDDFSAGRPGNVRPLANGRGPRARPS